MPKFYDYEKHGITQSILKTWLSCRMKAKLSLEGWSHSRPSYALTYGTIVHGVLERIYDLIRLKKLTKIPSDILIIKMVKEVEIQWKKENPGNDFKMMEMLDDCCLMAEATLPSYFKFWWKTDFHKIQWRNLEQEFKIPYTTKKGDKTFIRGKKDGVYGVKYVKLFETKTKSQINIDDLIDTLWYEFQVNEYLWAVKKTYKVIPTGVTYNLIRKTSLKRYKAESKVQFLTRVKKDVEKRPDFYFMRLNIAVSEKDMKVFAEEFDSIIQEFIDWNKGILKTYKNTNQCNDKYGRCEFCGVCSRGDYSNLVKRKAVFKELEDL